MRKTWKVYAVVITLTIFSLFLFPSCSDQKESAKPEQKKEPVKISIGYQPTVFYSYLFLAEQKGMFKDAALDVEFIKIPSANKMFQAYLAGQLNMTGLTATEIMFRGYEKVPGTFSCPLMVEINDVDVFDRVIVLKDSPIKTITDLKGKKIGSHPGTTVPNIMKALLRSHGVDPEETEIQKLKPNLQVDALLSGAVDAIICLEPSGSTLLASGKSRVLYEHPFGIIEKNFPASFTVLSKEFSDKHPEAAKRLVDVIRKSVKLYRQEAEKDKKAVDKIIVDKFGLDPKVAELINVVTYRLPEEWNQQSFDAVVDFYVKAGILSKPVKMDIFKHQ
ncbi:ABC transporter substrate-binding protein [Desulfobacula sp.]|uniref:ABC transporter substrate-binding protein n=1 Tax=Candidatus Desulfatibia vada TaxID=2841696 RepID=A0A8J6NSU6_9BACT|nr:ABC transporter substrate-binding protein [Candidatus Desulfatibia vada]MBL6994173.1 ABC transporter substrate-binding protein [Desulfobacula sp.]